jgi:hypothetical protein
MFCFATLVMSVDKSSEAAPAMHGPETRVAQALKMNPKRMILGSSENVVPTRFMRKSPVNFLNQLAIADSPPPIPGCLKISEF